MKTDEEMKIVLILQHFLSALNLDLPSIEIDVKIEEGLENFNMARDPFSILIDLNIFLRQIVLNKKTNHEVYLQFIIVKERGHIQMKCLIYGLEKKSLEAIKFYLETNSNRGEVNVSLSQYDYMITPSNKIKNINSPINHHGIPPYYAEIRKRLKSHFSSISSFEEFAVKKSLEHGLFLKRVHQVIEENIDNETFKVDQLYKALGLSRTQLYRKLKPLTKMSPAKYLIYYRLQKAKSLLQDTTYNVSQVVAMVGFTSHSYFTRAFCEQFGMNPSNMSRNITQL